MLNYSVAELRERRKEFVFLYLKLNHALKRDKSETYTLNSKTWLI